MTEQHPDAEVEAKEPGEVTDPQLGLEGEEEPLLKDDDKVDWPTEVNDEDD